MMQYRDSNHSYVNMETNERYTSVTTLIKKYKPTEDWKQIAINYVKKRTDEEILKDLAKKWELTIPEALIKFGNKFTAKKIQDIWALKGLIATTGGSNFHNWKEIQEAGDPNTIMTPIINDVKDGFNLDYIKPNHKYLEMMLYNHPSRVCGQADKIIIKESSCIIRDYKGLFVETPILTTTGFKRMDQLTTKDVVFDKNGNPTKITAVSEVHYNPCFRIKFDTNDEIIADHEHRWLVYFQKNKKQIEEIMTTEDLYNLLKNLKKRRSDFIPKIKMISNLETSKKKLPIDPYVLGLWLGDGHKYSGSLGNINQDIWNEIKKRGYKISNNYSKPGKTEQRTIYDIRGKLDSLNLLKNKHLPDLYLLGNREQRLECLRGLMDSDGYYNKIRKRFVMCTTQWWQVQAVVKLVSSLGWKPTVISATTYCTNCENPKKEIQKWDVCFNATECPFLVRNLKCIKHQGVKRDSHTYRNIKSIKPVEIVPTKCISVDSPSKTYLFGNSLIVTHNTVNKELSPDVKAFYNKKTKKRSVKKFKSPISNLPISSYWEYALQLSIYGYMLETYGYAPEKLIIDQVITKWIPVNKLKGEFVIDEDKELGKVRVLDKMIEVPLPYLRKEAKALLKANRK